MSGFSIDWLDLREPADHRARDKELLAAVKTWLADAASADQNLVTDLGAGTGSTLRTMIENDIPVNRWRLLDHDPTLLAEAQRRHASHVDLQIHCTDLTEVEALPLSDARLITASALFDLVSADYIDALLSALKLAPHAAVYAALNYDGQTSWTPAHPLDADVLAAFNDDQRRDKGFGPALGPDATDYMARAFTAAGYQVMTADSPWQLNDSDTAMVSALIRGIAQAVGESGAINSTALQGWLAFRLEHVTTGTCTVGHKDVLALPSL